MRRDHGGQVKMTSQLAGSGEGGGAGLQSGLLVPNRHVRWHSPAMSDVPLASMLENVSITAGLVASV
jgi:hypothetical protein